MTAQNIFLKSWRPYVWICCAGFLLYAKTLTYELTYLDDNVWILDYQWFMKNIHNIFQLFARPDFISKVFYRPVLGLSFMLNAWWGGTDPFVYHLTNILFHLINSCLVFVVLSQLSYPRSVSFISSLIFCVHPVLTQAVVWIPGRTDSLLALFVFLSFIFYLRFLKERGIVQMGAHFVFFILALLVKETAIVLPLCCAGYYFLIFEKEQKQKIRGSFIYFGWAFIVMSWVLLRREILSDSPPVPWETAIKSLGHNCPAIVVYIGKMMIPVHLSVLPILQDSTLLWGWMSLAFLTIGIVLSKHKRLPCMIFGGMWLVLFLLPSLVISFLNHEYRVYLPLFGFLIIILETGLIPYLRSHPKAGMALVGAGFVLFSGRAYFYSAQYQNRIHFWEQAVRSSPHSPLAQRNLGAMYYLDGQKEKAENHYRQALRLNPGEKMVYNNLALLYQEKGMLAEAETAYLQEIKYHPRYTDAYYNLGVLYFRQRKYDQAAAFWEKVIDLDDRYVEAYKNLVKVYALKKQNEKVKYYLQALKDREIPIP